MTLAPLDAFPGMTLGAPVGSLAAEPPVGLKFDKLSREYFDSLLLKLELPISTLAWDYDNTLGKTEVRALTNLTKVLNGYLESIDSEKRFDVETVVRDFKGKTCHDILVALDTERLQSAGLSEEHRTPASEISRLVALELDLNVAEFKGGMEVTEGTNQALQACKDMGLVQLVQSSSHGRRLVACLEGAGQSEFFGDRVFSAQSSMEEVKAKPDPAIVHFSLKAVGMSAASTVGIDDSASGNGALVNAQVFTIGFVGCETTDGAQKALAQKLMNTGAGLVVESLLDVPVIVDKLNRSKSEPALIEELVASFRDRWLK